MPYLTGGETALSLFPQVKDRHQGSSAAGGLLDRDCLVGLGVAARVAAWQELSGSYASWRSMIYGLLAG